MINEECHDDAGLQSNILTAIPAGGCCSACQMMVGCSIDFNEGRLMHVYDERLVRDVTLGTFCWDVSNFARIKMTASFANAYSCADECHGE